MDRQALAALQFEVVKLEGYLGVLTSRARLRADHAAYQFRPLGNLGSVGSLSWGFGLDHHTVANLGGF
jgi:hypothetical protein